MQILKSTKVIAVAMAIVVAYVPLTFIKNETYLFIMNYLYVLFILTNWKRNDEKYKVYYIILSASHIFCNWMFSYENTYLFSVQKYLVAMLAAIFTFLVVIVFKWFGRR